jgi:putative PIN family toxin of toxin-antitoxin system
MRIVADTSTVVSGILWHGAPRRVLDAARSGAIDLFTSTLLLVELEDVLQRGKFAQRLTVVKSTPRDLVLGYAALATIVKPIAIEPVILDDPDDDAVLACACAASAEAIVSGDGHLLDMKEYQNIPIINANDLLMRILK